MSECVAPAARASQGLNPTMWVMSESARYIASAAAIMVAGAVIAVGSILPWATFQFSFSFSLHDGISLAYGVVTLACGIALIAIGLAAIDGFYRSRLYWPATAVSLLTIVTILVARFEIPLRDDQAGQLELTFYAFGLTPVIIEAAAVAALIASFGIRAVPDDDDRPE